MNTLILVLAQTAPGISPWRAWLPLVGMMAVFYFILILPRQREMKRHQAMIGALQKGDTVVTAGGLIGEIQSIRDSQLTVRSGSATVVVERQRVARRITPTEAK